jgi:hypothetical protein
MVDAGVEIRCRTSVDVLPSTAAALAPVINRRI